MPFIGRREFLKIMGIGAAAATVPGLVACSKGEQAATAPLAARLPPLPVVHLKGFMICRCKALHVSCTSPMCTAS